MMSLKNILSRFLKQHALYWAPSGVTDTFGKMILEDPVQIKCRWEDKTELFRIRTGAELTSRAQVFTDRDLEEEGVLWLGTFATAVIADDSEGNPDPFVNKGAWTIMQFGKQPDRKAKNFLRWCWL